MFIIQISVIVEEVEPVVALVGLLVGDGHLGEEVGIALGVFGFTDIGPY